MVSRAKWQQKSAGNIEKDDYNTRQTIEKSSGKGFHSQRLNSILSELQWLRSLKFLLQMEASRMRPQIAGGTLERRSKTRSACVVRRYAACFRIISVAQCRESWKCVSLGRIDCDLLCRLRVPSNMLPVSGRGSTRPCATAQRHAGRLVEALDAPHQSPGWSYITLF